MLQCSSSSRDDQAAGSMPHVEERRRVGMRLSVLQYLITVAVLGARGQLLGAAGGRSTRSSRRWPRTTISGRCRCARRAAWCSTATAGCWSRTATPTASRSSASTPRDLNRTVRLLAAVLGVDEARRPRDRRSPPPRADAIGRSPSSRTRRWRRSRRSRRGGSTSSCRTSSSSRCRRGSIPTTLAAHLFGYVGEVNDAQVAERRRAEERRHRRPVGHREGLQRAADGRGRRASASSSTASAAKSGRSRKMQPTEGKRLQLTIDSDVQKAVEDGFKASGFNGAAVMLDPHNGEVLAFTSLPGLRSERVRRRHRSRDLGGAEHRRAPAAERPRDPGPLLARVDVQDGGRDGGARGRRDHAGLQGVTAPAARNFYGRRFKCWKKGGHGTMDLRHAIEQSCNVYFYTVGNMTGIDKIHKWATLLGLGEKSGIDLPNEVQGLVPSPEWKQRADRARSGTPARPSRCRSARAQVSVTPVSMAVYMATLANGGTRVTPHLLKAVDEGTAGSRCRRRRRSRRSPLEPGEAAGDPRRPVDGRERRRHRRPRADPGPRRGGQDRHGAGDLERGRGAAAQDDPGSARQRLVRVLRAARQPADCRRGLARARRCTAPTPRRSRITCSKRSSPSRTASRCRRRCQLAGDAAAAARRRRRSAADRGPPTSAPARDAAAD